MEFLQMLVLGYKRPLLLHDLGFFPSPSPSEALRKHVHHFVALRRSFIFGFCSRILVREAPWITRFEFLHDLHGSAFMRGTASFSMLIVLPRFGLFGTIPETPLDPISVVAFWTALACRIFISALDYRNSTFEDSIDI